jgi:hypothetical protein
MTRTASRVAHRVAVALTVLSSLYFGSRTLVSYKKRPFAPLSISIRFFHLVHLPHNGDNGSSGLIQASDGDEPTYSSTSAWRQYTFEAQMMDREIGRGSWQMFNHRYARQRARGGYHAGSSPSVEEYVGGKDAEIDGVMKTFQETSA